MSFIYAKNLKNRIYVFADSKLSISPNDEGRLIKRLGKGLYNNIKVFGVIKNVIINGNTCVAAAGFLEDFNVLLKLIDEKKDIKLEEICNEALKIHCEKNGRTDFIIAVSDICNSRLFEIKKYKVEEVQISWIGVYECFEMFKKIKMDPIEKDNLLPRNISLDANEYAEQLFDSRIFGKIIDDNIDNSVGGNVIECIGEYGKFIYKEKLYSCSEKRQEVQNGGIIKIYENVFDGGYTYHVYTSADNYKMYILQLEKGIVFEPYINDENYNHLRMPRIYEMNEKDFMAKVGVEKTSLHLLSNTIIISR